MSAESPYTQIPDLRAPVVEDKNIEMDFIEKLRGLKYSTSDIRDRAALEQNFREKFEALNRVSLTDGEFARLRDELITPDVFTAASSPRAQRLHPRRRHPPELHPGQHPGLVQKRPSRSSTSSASIPTTATTATTSFCSSTASPSSRSS